MNSPNILVQKMSKNMLQFNIKKPFADFFQASCVDSKLAEAKEEEAKAPASEAQKKMTKKEKTENTMTTTDDYNFSGANSSLMLK